MGACDKGEWVARGPWRTVMNFQLAPVHSKEKKSTSSSSATEQSKGAFFTTVPAPSRTAAITRTVGQRRALARARARAHTHTHTGQYGAYAWAHPGDGKHGDTATRWSTQKQTTQGGGKGRRIRWIQGRRFPPYLSAQS